MNRNYPHPGQVLEERFLKPFSLRPYTVARMLGIPRTRIERVVEGRLGVTADTALRLAKLFNTSPEFWLELQNRHDLAMVRPTIARDVAAISHLVAKPEETGTRPVIPYFGSKWRIAPKYPPPLHGTIIEPFAGGAGYALRYHDRQVILVEKSAALAAMWRYLIAASPNDVLGLPDVPVTASLDDRRFAKLTLGERTLIGFWLAKGRGTPNAKPSSWAVEYPTRLWGPEIRKNLSGIVHHVKHWRVVHGDYTKAPDVPATWFVDPPYKTTGNGYSHGARAINFAALATWCKGRQGQVIVCENGDANWLPFKKLGAVNGIGGPDGNKKRVEEVFYIRRKTL